MIMKVYWNVAKPLLTVIPLPAAVVALPESQSTAARTILMTQLMSDCINRCQTTFKFRDRRCALPKDLKTIILTPDATTILPFYIDSSWPTNPTSSPLWNTSTTLIFCDWYDWTFKDCTNEAQWDDFVNLAGATRHELRPCAIFNSDITIADDIATGPTTSMHQLLNCAHGSLVWMSFVEFFESRHLEHHHATFLPH